jgi:hypothetical protein
VRLRLLLLAALLSSVVAAGCSSDGGSVEPAATTTSTGPAGASTTSGQTPASTKDTASPGTSSGCSTEGDTQPKSDGFPDRMSALIGKDLRSAVYDECTERVVIELQGDGDFPGWQVAYPDGPVTAGESEDPVDLAGDAILEATVGSWMTTMEGTGYTGPTDIKPSGRQAVKEIKLVGNDEGVMRWAIGLDQERPFEVSVLPNPPRLVIDIATP